MSIYGTWLSIEHPDQWLTNLEAEGIDAAIIGDDSESRELGSPWVYEGSHHLPERNGRRGGSLEVGAIPGFITRDGRDDQVDGRWDWLRISVDSEDSTTQYEGNPYIPGGRAVVVLDRAQAEALRDTISHWLDRTEEEDA